LIKNLTITQIPTQSYKGLTVKRFEDLHGNELEDLVMQEEIVIVLEDYTDQEKRIILTQDWRGQECYISQRQ
jgi:hypothetical protein